MPGSVQTFQRGKVSLADMVLESVTQMVNFYLNYA